MEEIIKKAGEYYQLAAHLHMRGMSDVIQECIPHVKKLMDEGITFEAFIKSVETKYSAKINLEKDLFMQQIENLFKTITTQTKEET